MKALGLLIATACLATAPALAQQGDPGARGTQQGVAGSAQQSSEFRERAAAAPIEQSAEIPLDAPRYYNRHPGRLTKLGAANGIAPEVQADVEARELQRRAGQGR